MLRLYLPEKKGLQVAVGLFSLSFGLFLTWQYSVQEHLIF